MKIPKSVILTLIVFFYGLSAAYSQGTTLKVTDYPTELLKGIPVTISSGVGATGVNVVTGIEINDRSINGWTLTITSANGASTQPRLKHEINNTTIDYSLEINNITGILAPGLILSPPVNTTLVFSGSSTIISATGTTNGRTRKFTFDLITTISNAATIGRLAGNYTDQLTLVLVGN